MALAGKTIAFTGEMVGMTRKEATAIAKAAGATVGSATSKNIQYLFAGEGATPAKTMNAQQNGIQVLAAPQFNQWTQGIKAPVAAPVATPAIQYPATTMAAAPAVQTGNLSGKTIAFCGQFTEKPIAQMMGTAQAAGATVVGTVDANLSMLVVGKMPGAIAFQARQQGVQTISEAQFARITRNAPVQTYQAPAPVAAAPAPMMKPRGRRPRSASPAAPVQTYQAPAPVQTYQAPVVQAPIADEAPAGPMPWETEVVDEAPVAQTFAPAPVARAPRAPRAKKVAAMQAPMQTYQAPAPVAPVAPVAAAPVTMAGQNIVFTGTLQVNRFVAATMASKAGAIPSSSLSAKTNLLVCGANAGEKMAKAQAMGVRCISEAEFVAACRV